MRAHFLRASLLLASTAAAATQQQTIALSADAATGIFVGLFLLVVLGFAIMMLSDIQTSDTIGQPKKER